MEASLPESNDSDVLFSRHVVIQFRDGGADFGGQVSKMGIVGLGQAFVVLDVQKVECHSVED